jgi:hypothetical protein
MNLRKYLEVDMKMKEQLEEDKGVTLVYPAAIQMFGEVHEDGQFRGNMKNFSEDEQNLMKQHGLIRIGEYALWGVDGEDIYICHVPSGEMGAFKKKDFETHVSAFFGLNF